jgi:Ala-tRNA(Pro) deacylase
MARDGLLRAIASDRSKRMTGDPHSGLSGTRIAAVTEYLRAEGIAHDVIEHRQTLSATAEAAATERPPHQVAKTVVLHDHGAYLLAVIPASQRLDLHKLRAVLDASKSLQLATERQMAADFPQLEVGAVPPLGPMVPAAEVVDHRLLEEDRVLCAGGDHTHSVLLDPRDIVAAADATVADVCED